MCKVLMSINPEHVDNIISGAKTFEYRKVKCRRKIDSIVIYSTSPIMKVVAEVKVIDLIEGTPDYVWEKTNSGSGINKKRFDSYYSKKKMAFAYCLGKVVRFDKPRTLADYGITKAPQSFIYLN